MNILNYRAADGSGFGCDSPAAFFVTLMAKMPAGPVVIENTGQALVITELVCIEAPAAPGPLGLAFGG